MANTANLFYKWGGGMKPDFPRIRSAHDEFLVTEDGRELVDAAAGAAVVNLGHSVEGVESVADAQLSELSYLSLSHFSHEAPEALAETLAAVSPGDLNAAFFVNSGSEANEMAFKLARAYHRETGNPHKSTIIGRWQSYHGATLGALSATGNTSRRSEYEPLLHGWPHVPPAYPYRWEYEGTPEEQAIAAAAELETTIKQEGPETVAAFIAEPVSGASIPAAHPHPAYFQEVRRICDEYDVLFIADEVMTGFGRTGTMFAMEHFDVVPDMMALGKGLSGGYAPISATMVRDEIADEFENGTGRSFSHGHTFGGNPLSAAIAAHVVDQYTDSVLQTGRKRGELLAAELEPLADNPIVGDFRQIGAMIGIEFVADRDTGEPFDPDLNVNGRVYDRALERGVYTYPGSGSVDGLKGDHLMLSPPLTISEPSVRIVAEAVTDAVDAVAESVAPHTVSN
ncbi:aminotransferase family protein [Natronorubrum texcoconense]|uniref:Adenosylmethionine-8-amino-7-oxononanoate aminotransferase n=1 Tax=Natronorubrum texcoconense TaxID=1095776 RepID=A0A1G9DAG3_9EURY|nr:aminotransferase class III-fold pyridoxal phosphate-dependent enzyme [Natronorubrum texcoconense]SDK60908.1 Adenosylmethionine-8-amino-7-oxononanoate aminotransferase [Natronorubrum texcoconense]